MLRLVDIDYLFCGLVVARPLKLTLALSQKINPGFLDLGKRDPIINSSSGADLAIMGWSNPEHGGTDIITEQKKLDFQILNNVIKTYQFLTV